MGCFDSRYLFVTIFSVLVHLSTLLLPSCTGEAWLGNLELVHDLFAHWKICEILEVDDIQNVKSLNA